MSLSGMYDAVIDVYEATESTGSMRSRSRSWTKVVDGTENNARIWDEDETHDGTPAGEKEIGRYRGACPVSFDAVGGGTHEVDEGDVLDVQEGPYAGQKMIVEGAAKKTAGRKAHHTRLRLRTWNGSLT